jgi:hypothetical protein
MRRPSVLSLLIGLVFVGLWAGHWTPARAFNLSPEGTKLERVTAQQSQTWYARWIAKVLGDAIRHFAEPVHEEITHRIYDCDGDRAVCGQVDIEFAPWTVLYGVRWNDDPPFGLTAGQATNTSCKVNESVRLITQPKCWRELFNDAKKGAAAGKKYDGKSGAALIYRVHFGDLQFLHSMASRDGERAGETQSRVMMWAEFVWRVASAEYDLGTMIKDVKIDGLNERIGRPDWRVQDLFTYGMQMVRPHIRDVAFGSVLHMVQDSFAKGHTDRSEPTYREKCRNAGAEQHLAPGRIREFHAYNLQNQDEHSRYDGRVQLMGHISNTHPHVIMVGKDLRKYYAGGAGWDAVKPYLQCVFAIENPDTPGSPGDGFTK